MSDKENEPIILRKKSRKKHASHGGAWKVAYADFVTAMMALFIVLWISSQNEELRQAVAAYFRDPGLGMFSMPRVPPSLMDEKIGTAKELSYAQWREKKDLETLGGKIKKILAKQPKLQPFLAQTTTELVSEGLRIELCDKPGLSLFEPGTAILIPAGEEILKLIARELGYLTNQVIIEGHTESRLDSNTENYKNFGLSIERANSTLRGLIAGGLRNTQVAQITGYADRRLRNPNVPFDIANRRISILVVSNAA
jgi:chemotaxis protein MotB